MSDKRNQKPFAVIMGGKSAPGSRAPDVSHQRIRHQSLQPPKDRCQHQAEFDGDALNDGKPEMPGQQTEADRLWNIRVVLLVMLALGTCVFFVSLWTNQEADPSEITGSLSDHETVASVPEAVEAPSSMPASLVVSAMGPTPRCVADCTWGNLAENGYPKTVDGKHTIVCGNDTWLVATVTKIDGEPNRHCYTTSGISAP